MLSLHYFIPQQAAVISEKAPKEHFTLPAQHQIMAVESDLSPRSLWKPRIVYYSLSFSSQTYQVDTNINQKNDHVAQ